MKLTKREELMSNIVTPLMISETPIIRSEINKLFEHNKDDIISSFKGAIDKLANEAVTAQASSQKSDIHHIGISILQSSILTKSFDLQIAFFEEDLYLDLNKISAYWKPEFIFPLLLSVPDTFDRFVKSKMIRVMNYEMHEVLKVYQLLCLSLLGETMTKVAARISVGNKALKTAPRINVLFGLYMDQFHLISTIKGVVL